MTSREKGKKGKKGQGKHRKGKIREKSHNKVIQTNPNIWSITINVTGLKLVNAKTESWLHLKFQILANFSS